jgi:hypothetical protein
MSELEHFAYDLYPHGLSHLAIEKPFLEKNPELGYWIFSGKLPLGPMRTAFMPGWLAEEAANRSHSFYFRGRDRLLLLRPQQTDFGLSEAFETTGSGFPLVLMKGSARYSKLSDRYTVQPVDNFDDFADMIEVRGEGLKVKAQPQKRETAQRFLTNPDVFGLVGWQGIKRVSSAAFVINGTDATVWDLTCPFSQRDTHARLEVLKSGLNTLYRRGVEDVYDAIEPVDMELYQALGFKSVGGLNIFNALPKG